MTLELQSKALQKLEADKMRYDLDRIYSKDTGKDAFFLLIHENKPYSISLITKIGPRGGIKCWVTFANSSVIPTLDGVRIGSGVFHEEFKFFPMSIEGRRDEKVEGIFQLYTSSLKILQGGDHILESLYALDNFPDCCESMSLRNITGFGGFSK